MSANRSNEPKILVTGASGKLGDLVLTHLIETYEYPAENIIAVSRDPKRLGRWAEVGVETRKADFSDPDSLTESLQGADKGLLISTDSLDNDIRLRDHRNAVASAKDAGVGHVYYTSMPAAENSLVAFAPVHYGTEQVLKESGLTWTILRNNWYMESLLLSIPGAVATGSFFTSVGDGKIAYISRNDLAKAAAAALVATSGVDNATFTLTGTEALSIESVAARVSRAIDKPISVIQVPLEAMIEGAKSHGFPEAVAVVFASFDTASKAGNLAGVTSDFAKLTGSAPKSFEVWLAENKEKFLQKA